MKNVGANTEIVAITRRLEQLERVLRIWRTVLVLVVIFGSLTGSAAILNRAKGEDNGKKTDVLSVGGLVLVDKNGQPRGIWSVNENGSVMLALEDTAQNARLGLLVDRVGQTEITMLDAAGHTRGSWLAAANGDAGFVLTDAKAKALFGAKIEGTSAYWQLNDANGKTRAMCSVLGNPGLEKAELGFYDTNQKRRLALLTTDDGIPVIAFPDASDPAGVLGGWYTSGAQVATLPKGNLSKFLGQK